MQRLIGFLATLGAVASAALVFGMTARIPASALHVPDVHLAAAGRPIALTPEKLGAHRTARGLQIRQDTLERTLRELEVAFARPPKPAQYVLTPQGPVLDLGTPGQALDVPAARAMFLRALRGADRDLTLPVTAVPAPPPPPFAIIVDLSRLRLDLYEGTTLRKEFVVGIGALRFPTPPGAYSVKSKAKNPTWNNPGSAWARNMPRYIAPGPRNPLGTRALRLDRQSLVIHGTPDQSSIGRRSSHGCIRMRKADIEELYEIVPIQTPVFIIP